MLGKVFAYQIQNTEAGARLYALAKEGRKCCMPDGFTRKSSVLAPEIILNCDFENGLYNVLGSTALADEAGLFMGVTKDVIAGFGEKRNKDKLLWYLLLLKQYELLPPLSD